MLIKLNTTPIAAIIDLLCKRPTKNVSVTLYITLTNIPIIVGIDILINSGKIGFVKIARRRNSFASISAAPYFTGISVDCNHVAVLEFCSSKTDSQYRRYIKFPCDNGCMT